MDAIRQWLGQLQWNILIEMLISVGSCLLCITFHEMCHGLAAYAMGDSTAKRAGRLTLNPLRHVDIMGLIMLAVAKFGWAKPVPIDPRNFRQPKLGMALTALAGPAANVLLTFLAVLCYGASVFAMVQTGLVFFDYLSLFFYYVIYISAGLAVFNLLPIPPLDGSKVLFAVLPPKWYWRLMRFERYGMIALVVLLLTGVLDVPLNVMREGLVSALSPASQWMFERLMALIS